MDCKQVDELLVDYIYQEMDMAQQASFEAHLEGCTQCARDVEDFQQTRSVMQGLPELEPPPAISQLLLEEARRAAPGETGARRKLRDLLRVFVLSPSLAAAVTLVAVLGVSFYAYRNAPLTQQQPRSDLPLSVEEGYPATIARPGSAADPEAAASPPAEAEKKELDERQATGIGAEDETRSARPAADAPLKVSGPQQQGTARGRLGYLGGKGGAADKNSEEAPARGLDGLSSTRAKDDRGGLADDGDRAPAAEPVAKAALKRPAARASRQSLPRRQRRRAANAIDVGGGSGVWGNSKAGSGYGAPKPSSVAASSEGRAAPAADQKKSGKRDAASAAYALLRAGDSAVRAGRCDEAFTYYEKALQMRGDLSGAIADRIGPCEGKLYGNKRHTVLAGRVSYVRKARAKRMARKKAKAGSASKVPAAQRSYDSLKSK